MNELITQGGFLTTQANQTAIAAQVSAQASKAAQEVQMAFITAKRFPRDEVSACFKMKVACKRKEFAAKSGYSYVRGGKTVAGPSIHLANMVKIYWGNIISGVVIIDQTEDISNCIAFAVDLENNVRKERCFTVRHERKANGKIVKLTDPRDISELVNNYGSRNERECIFAVVPQDVIEEAYKQCIETLEAGFNGKTIDQRVKDMVMLFMDYGVSADDLTAFVGKKLEAMTPTEFTNLASIFNSIRDGQADPSMFFKTLRVEKEEQTEQKTGTEKLMEQMAAKKAKKLEAEKPAAPVETIACAPIANAAVVEPDPTPEPSPAAPDENPHEQTDKAKARAFWNEAKVKYPELIDALSTAGKAGKDVISAKWLAAAKESNNVDMCVVLMINYIFIPANEYITKSCPPELRKEIEQRIGVSTDKPLTTIYEAIGGGW